MGHPEGARSERGDRFHFDRRVRVEFRGTQLSSDGGLLVMREMDDALGLSDLAATAQRDTRGGKNTIHRLDGLFRQPDIQHHRQTDDLGTGLEVLERRAFGHGWKLQNHPALLKLVSFDSTRLLHADDRPSENQTQDPRILISFGRQ